MNTPIVERSAGDTVTGAPPIRNLPTDTNIEVNSVNAANPLFIQDDFFGPQDTAIPVPVVESRDQKMFLSGFIDQGIAFRTGDRHWLLHDHVFTRFEATQPEVSMCIVGSYNSNHIGIRIREKSIHRVVHLDAWKILSCDREPFGINLDHSRWHHSSGLHEVEVGFTHVVGTTVTYDGSLESRSI